MKVTKTLKIPFLRLNQSKIDEFSRLEKINTDTANFILKMDKEEKRILTTKSFSDVKLGSAWVNQTIRNSKAKTKVKYFKKLPLETNNQNWNLHKNGDTYSVSFGLIRGIKKRVPLEIHQANHSIWLDAILDGSAKKGSIKLWCSKKGIWYALLSVSMEVPDIDISEEFLGVDRGQNHIAISSINGKYVRFYRGGVIKQLRRRYQKLRKKLQELGKHRMVRKLESKERRIMTHINHCISKDLVQQAKEHGVGILFEDLSGIRNAKQRKKTKSDAGNNRDTWAYYQLEQFVKYKAEIAGVYFEKIPPQYTSQTCSRCKHIGKRHRHSFKCNNCGLECNADWNASRNISTWFGSVCSLGVDLLKNGLHDIALNLVSEINGNIDGSRTRIPCL